MLIFITATPVWAFTNSERFLFPHIHASVRYHWFLLLLLFCLIYSAWVKMKFQSTLIGLVQMVMD